MINGIEEDLPKQATKMKGVIVLVLDHEKIDLFGLLRDSLPKATRRLNKLWTTNFLKPFGFEAGGGKSERPQNKKKFRASDFKRKAR